MQEEKSKKSVADKTRNKKILELRDKGLSFRMIKKALNLSISHQRVKQIVDYHQSKENN